MSRNPFSTLTRLLAVCIVGWPVAATFTGCGGDQGEPENTASSKYEVADDSDASPSSVPSADVPDGVATPAGDVPAPPTMPPMDVEGSVDLETIPDGETELLAYLEKLQSWQPQAPRSQQEFVAQMTKMKAISQAKLTAADKLLAATEDQRTRLAATQAKLDAMRALAQTGDQQKTKELHGYCRVLADGQDEEIAEVGRLTLFELAVNDLLRGRVDDVQAIVEELKKRAAANPDNPGVFNVLANAAGLMAQIGEPGAASEALLALHEAYKDSKDPKLAAQVPQLLTQAQALELNQKLTALLSGEGGDPQPVMDAVASMLGGENLQIAELNTTSGVAQTLEMAGYYKEASEAFASIEQAYKDHAQFAEMAAQRGANSEKRVGLVGQPFVVEGVLPDGSPFDWSLYQGKVVLVDFWASWCRPCVEEIPNIEASYEKFRDKGFEVVGVNLDEDPQSLERFLTVQPLKWATVVGGDPESLGFNNPMAEKCGIDAIPFVVLVDREGKVNAIHVRGKQLEEKLTELLGPVAEEPPAVPAVPTVPAAPVLPTAPEGTPAPGDAAEPAAPTVPAVPIVPPENATPPTDPAPPETPSPQSHWSPKRGAFFLSRSRSLQPTRT